MSNALCSLSPSGLVASGPEPILHTSQCSLHQVMKAGVEGACSCTGLRYRWQKREGEGIRMLRILQLSRNRFCKTFFPLFSLSLPWPQRAIMKNISRKENIKMQIKYSCDCKLLNKNASTVLRVQCKHWGLLVVRPTELTSDRVGSQR